ncbi:MAG: ATP-dependent DNA helicase RecG [Oscillospiraceae bacterium]|nr:ATP-dependent DNA helicase RecG [Oscillospiraceae bacterium]
MAPTEILAEQHLRSLSPLLEPLGVRCALLTGSMKESEKKHIREALASGDISLVIGTHALISERTVFSRLGLVIADEQHRFGVEQRGALGEKGDAPHMLFMSATPIPRTMSMLLYGDLNVSVLDELPPGRQKIETYLVNEQMRSRINNFIRRQVDEGHQVYIVCPAIEEGEDESLKSAELWAETLQRSVFPDRRVALLHGRMKGQEKEAVMRSFADGETDILVATTVIEVGVDVPNATLMVIENAERFGLSQLHQLRGRVGRGSAESYCVLFSENKNPDTQARLKALCATNDGFAIAEQDLMLRGPGDFFGSQQHGLPAFKVANLSLDVQTLQRAKAAAERADLSDPASPLAQRIDMLFSHGTPVLN